MGEHACVAGIGTCSLRVVVGDAGKVAQRLGSGGRTSLYWLGEGPTDMRVIVGRVPGAALAAQEGMFRERMKGVSVHSHSYRRIPGLADCR